MFKKIDVNSLPENVRGLVNKTKTELLNIIDRKDNVEKELNTKKIDPYSPEYGKLIIKRLNSFKADVISAFNKYFGKNSVFSEFNLSDMIR